MGIELGLQAKSAEKPSIIVSGLGQGQVSTMDEGAKGAADVVLDTNVVLDWLVFDDPATRPLAAALEAGRLRWIATGPMLDELLHVLQRPELDRWRAACEAARERVAAAGCRVEM
ncbi:PIN domain-containing protein, partial [Rubrivivax gelatinosus]|uniref:PIN domain-containing protein n=1 Tax=Rubrivivax gelatinosus TaxID=28068 RepID=UPI003F7AE5AD